MAYRKECYTRKSLNLELKSKTCWLGWKSFKSFISW